MSVRNPAHLAAAPLKYQRRGVVFYAVMGYTHLGGKCLYMTSPPQGVRSHFFFFSQLHLFCTLLPFRDCNYDDGVDNLDRKIAPTRSNYSYPVMPDSVESVVPPSSFSYPPPPPSLLRFSSCAPSSCCRCACCSPPTVRARCRLLFRPDVYIPTKKYAQVVTNMNEAKRRADSKLLQAEQKEIALSKAERARYLADRKT